MITSLTQSSSKKERNLHPSLDLPVSQDHPITQIKTNAVHQLHRDSVSLIVW